MQNKVIHRLSYYRNTLADAAKMNPDIAALQKEKKILYLKKDEVMSGVVENREDMNAFISRSLQGSKSPLPQKGDDGKISGILCPWIYMPEVVHGTAVRTSPFALICIPVVLSSEGILSPTGDLPWIPRTILQPLNSEGATVGSLEDSDRFLASLKTGSVQTWKDMVRTCLKYISAVTGYKTPPRIESYVLDDSSAFFCSNTVKATVHVEKLYNYLLDHKETYPLLERLIEGVDNSSSLLSFKEEISATRNHVGSMSPQFPLSPSQRLALHHFIRTKNGEVLALNGPPGTGKTTMLQSIVAQLWVDAAIHKDKCPLIVASSTNNQAVTNIIDSFAKVAVNEDDPLYQRWIPDVSGFGLQMAREKRWKDGFHSYDNSFKNGKPETSGLFKDIECRKWLEEAEVFFLKRASERYGDISDVSSAAEHIHDELEKCRETVASLIDAVVQLNPSGREVKIKEEVDLRRKSLTSDLDHLENEIKEGQAQLSHAEETLLSWDKHISNESFIQTLLSSMTPIRKRREAGDRAFLLERGISVEFPDPDRENIRAYLYDKKEEAESALIIQKKHLEEQKRALLSLSESWSRVCSIASIPEIDLTPQEISFDSIIDRLDTTIRARAFRIASHYWEAEYLKELRHNLDSLNPKDRDSAAPEKKARMYRRFAKLVPCQIATFFMLPNYYCGYKGKPVYMLDEIDLLIVDEAGQVSPEIGTPSFSLAKKALVVGDTFQIEPVWSVTEGTDMANAIESDVVSSEEEYEELVEKGFFSASGNLMRMAQLACRYTQYSDLCPGMMLVEHRRCVPEIICYCNELVYGGKLEPCRKESHEERQSRPSFLPAMGEIGIRSKDERKGGSLRNKKEAAYIANWVNDHLNELENRYGKKIGEILGIVTPFTAQKTAVQKKLTETLGGSKGIVVGTVHALQGAERDVVIFSPVYGSDHSGNTFFDVGPNMMNVAVSRARDSFIVIGNPDLFTKGSGKPSGILASHIRKDRGV